MESLNLKDPIPTGDGKVIASIMIGAPRLADIQKFLLAIGPDTIRTLMENADRDEANPTPAKEPSGKARRVNLDAEPNEEQADEELPEDNSFDRALLAKLLGDLIRQERFDAFNAALGSYLSLEPDQAARLSLQDLVVIAGKVVGFFTEVAPMIAGMVKDETSEEQGS
ncbi:hypothetical protein TRICHSKD4_1833 [Roseibium sp. TrichSKD4]|uniref:hypothetical protein n=1 Tax=Roseibium sp. TrichSKD4 TaxID=744980 RepID=UPI0001E56C97|nr:hypothetical protein [Roseibium sp. TrichSKD4]EFO33207.1 hypothetical protein TRICHSKD4_1833 [Roseibium sp. TrichSKD4]